MLASHWSRGVSENFQRGYPYDPETLPIEHFLPQMTLDWFILDISLVHCISSPLGGGPLASTSYILCLGVPMECQWNANVVPLNYTGGEQLSQTA